jgi:hypothetical protein
MFAPHQVSYAVDNLVFALSLIPFVLVFVLIAASLAEEPLRIRATVRARSFDPGVERIGARLAIRDRSRPRRPIRHDTAASPLTKSA